MTALIHACYYCCLYICLFTEFPWVNLTTTIGYTYLTTLRVDYNSVCVFQVITTKLVMVIITTPYRL